MTMNKKIMTILTLVMAVGVIGTAYASHTSYFGDDCDELYETTEAKTCNDLNNLNDRITILESVPLEPLGPFMVFDPADVKDNDHVSVSGQVEYDGSDHDANLTIFGPDGSAYHWGNNILVNEDGSFYSVKALYPAERFDPNGPDGYHQVRIVYGDDKIEIWGGFNYTRIQ